MHTPTLYRSGRRASERQREGERLHTQPLRTVLAPRARTTRSTWWQDIKGLPVRSTHGSAQDVHTNRTVTIVVTTSAEKPRQACRGWRGVGRAGLNVQEPNKTYAVPEPSLSEGTA